MVSFSNSITPYESILAQAGALRKKSLVKMSKIRACAGGFFQRSAKIKQSKKNLGKI